MLLAKKGIRCVTEDIEKFVREENTAHCVENTASFLLSTVRVFRRDCTNTIVIMQLQLSPRLRCLS